MCSTFPTALIRRGQEAKPPGQVLPIEDVERILGFTNSVVRTACICRYAAGQRDARYCYGISMAASKGLFEDLVVGADNSYLKGPDAPSSEKLTPSNTPTF